MTHRFVSHADDTVFDPTRSCVFAVHSWKIGVLPLGKNTYFEIFVEFILFFIFQNPDRDPHSTKLNKSILFRFIMRLSKRIMSLSKPIQN